MAGTILTGTYVSGITLTAQYTTIAGTGLITVTNEYALYGAAGTPWSVTNYGQVTETGTSLGAIHLDGGAVTNQTSGTLTGFFEGVLITAGLGTVSNSGKVTATSTAGVGVFLDAGGSVANQAGGTITGAADGVLIETTPGTVSNAGMIAGASSAGVELTVGGQITNATGGVIDGNTNGVEVLGAAGTVTNYGTLDNTGTVTTTTTSGGHLYHDGVFLQDGGTVVNGASGSTQALIEAQEGGVYGGGSDGIETPNAPTTVVNFGTIEVLGTAFPAITAVILASGGTVTNYGVILSQGSGRAIELKNAAGTVVNSGAIESTGTGQGVYFGDGGVITNAVGGQITGRGVERSLF